MSKGTIGSVLGGGIGFLIGGPTGARIGWMVGGAVGSSFETIPGRKVGEMASPRAQEGEPIPLVFGSARVTGRLMSTGKPVIRKEKQRGKGGPKVENETAYLSYSILICESSELRDSSIGGILMVIENNEIVYDVRDNPAISAADSAKWLKNKKFYFGGETQGTDPTEEMIHGAGNVPAYRGWCRMVATEENVTQHGGSVPTYEFVTSQCGVVEGVAGGARWISHAHKDLSNSYIHTSPDGADWLTEPPATIPWLGGRLVCTDTHAVMVNATEAGVTAYAPISDIGNWTAGPSHGSIPGGAACPEYIAGKLFVPRSNLGYAWTSDPTAGYTLVSDGDTYVIVGNASMIVRASAIYAAVSTDGGDSWSSHVRIDPSRGITIRCGAASLSRIALGGIVNIGGGACIYYTDNGVDFTAATLSSAVGTPIAMLHVGGGEWLALFKDDSFGNHVWRSTDNCQSFAPVTLPAAVSFQFSEAFFRIIDKDSTGRVTLIADTAGGRTYFTYFGGVWSECADDDGNVFNILALRGGGGTGTELPDSPGYYIDPDTGEISGPTTTPGDCPPITLSEIVDKLDARAGIPSANSVTTELDGIEVPGYAIDTFLTVAEAKEPLRQVWFFDCPEWDDAIRYRLRGHPTDFTIDPDDLIEGEDATESATRGQTVEYPKRLHVQYIDPATGYKPMKQTAERISPDIRVKGEVVAGANITLDADTAKRGADIGLKSAWTEREDSREFAIPIDYWPKAIAAHTFSLEGRRFRITELRLEAGAIYIKAVYDRISAYSSNAVGVVGPPPTGGSNLRGPTVSALMNLPVLRDADDRAGIYWAASGLLPTWQGALLQLNRGTWENGPQVTASATMGVLTAPLASASRYGMDDANVLSVKLTPTSDALDSLTYDDLIAENNAAAILYADGTAEIIQFQVATETAPREYELTGLLRGRQDTVVGSHADGAQFVLLDDAVRFVGLRQDDLGKTLTFRAVSLGTEADAAATKTLTLTTMQSLREWQPEHVAWERDSSNDMLIEWVGRARLGSSRTPVHSQHFGGYLVTVKNGATSHSWETTEQALLISAADQTTHFGGYAFTPTEVTVVAISRAQQGAVGTPVTFPSGLAGWVAVQAGWSEVGGVAQYDPTISGESVGYLYLNDPQPFALGSGKTFRGEVDVSGLGTGGSSVGAVACFQLNGSTYVGATLGNVDHPHSTLVAYPATARTHCAVGVVAITDGTNVVTFQNLAYAIT